MLPKMHSMKGSSQSILESIMLCSSLVMMQHHCHKAKARLGVAIARMAAAPSS